MGNYLVEYKYNMTSHSGNIAKLIGERLEEIMRVPRDRAIDRKNWCEGLHRRLVVIHSFLTGPRKKKNTELKSKQHLYKIT